MLTFLHIFRLKGKRPPKDGNLKYTPWISHINNDLIYKRLDVGVLEALNLLNPLIGRYRARKHRNDDRSVVALEMPKRFAVEILCDWIGAGKAILGAKANTPAWYVKNKDNIILHPATRDWVECALITSDKVRSDVNYRVRAITDKLDHVLNEGKFARRPVFRWDHGEK